MDFYMIKYTKNTNFMLILGWMAHNLSLLSCFAGLSIVKVRPGENVNQIIPCAVSSGKSHG